MAINEYSNRAEYEREVGRRVIALSEHLDAAALERWERNRRNNIITTAIAVVAFVAMAFITPVSVASWSALVIAGCLVVRCWFVVRRPDQE